MSSDRVPLPDEKCDCCGGPVGDTYAWAGTHNPPRKFLLCSVCTNYAYWFLTSQPVTQNRAERRASARQFRK